MQHESAWRIADSETCAAQTEVERFGFHHQIQDIVFDLPDGILRVVDFVAPADLFGQCDLVVSGPEEVSRLLCLIADWAAGRQSE